MVEKLAAEQMAAAAEVLSRRKVARRIVAIRLAPRAPDPGGHEGGQRVACGGVPREEKPHALRQ